VLAFVQQWRQNKHTTAFMRTCNAFAGRWMTSTVTLKYGDLTETIPLFEGRLHIPTIKDAFTLRVARIDGILAPVDSQGFTYAMFKPGDTLKISGTSAEVAAMPGTLHSRELLQWQKHKIHMLQSIHLYHFVLYITAVTV